MRSLQFRNELVIVLDDYHEIEHESIHRAITGLVEHLPPQAHLVIAARVDPPLPLARLRARGLLNEVRAEVGLRRELAGARRGPCSRREAACRAR